ncbi:MAG: hypothetical protein ACJ789_11135 [Thermomicrobiales bacterium]
MIDKVSRRDEGGSLHGCLGHGFAWLLVSILIMALMLVVVLGCYGLTRLAL